jgi:ABC-type lipoprotein export system ATPase subunit
MSKSEIASRYTQILKKLNLEEIAHSTPQALSGGEKQKVAIARALIHTPAFIIADEPTGNLDWEDTQEIGNHLIQANASGNTIILITHDIHLLNYIKSKTNVRIFQM